MVREPRFCPFCREPFDGEVCPDHGLALVPFAKLGPRREVPNEHARLSPMDLRFGRGIVLGGALAVLLGFAMPAIVDESRRGATTSGFALFQLRADYLGVVPAAALVVLLVAFSRRTRRELQRARLALASVVAIAGVAVAIAARHVLAYARAVADEGAVRPGSGAFVVVLGLVVLFVGATRLGRAP